MTATRAPWLTAPHHVGPIPPAWRAYFLLPQAERDLIRQHVERSGIHPAHHAYLTHAILYSLQARDDRKRRVRPARLPAALRSDYGRDVASQRVRDAVLAVRAHREREAARRREQRAADHQWNPDA